MLYTGKGDGGTTKLFGCDQPRIAKSSEVQEALFIIQAEVAGSDKRLREGAAEALGEVVNEIEKEIPPITGFSIAGGTELSAKLDVAPTVARKAERRVTAANLAGRAVSDPTKAYLNRLS